MYTFVSMYVKCNQYYMYIGPELDQVWSILPALELLPLDFTRHRFAA